MKTIDEKEIGVLGTQLDNAGMQEFEHIIGIDDFHDHIKSWCLARGVNGEYEIVMMKAYGKGMPNFDDFESDLKVISRVFDAKILRNN